jgi:peptide/nickel transport system substrate-binding protein
VVEEGCSVTDTHDQTNDPHERRLNRRDALLGAGGMAAAAGLAACGSSGSSSASSSSAASSSSGASSSAASGTTAAAGPKHGGNLRVGVAGDGAKDIVDGQNIIAKSDQMRLVAGWETLINYDRNYQLVYNGLAQEVTRSAPDEYVVRLRPGVQFHNGKTLSADDVIYSIQRLVNPKLALFGGAALASVDPKQLKKVDPLTVRVKLKTPDSTIPDALAQYVCGIVPVGYTGKGTSVATGQIGTGPFVLQSFAPGKQSIHTRFANYWQTGKPYVDQVTVINIDNDTARVNALVSGQIDVDCDIPFAQAPVVKQNSSLVLFENQGGGWLPFCMAIDQPPFTDVRVRQAMRLIVDRPQMVAQALAGHGRVGNDLYGVFDADYASDIAQRTQDIAQAKSLLAAAGHANLTVDLQTTAAAAGMVEMANVLATQAKAAGVTINVKVLDGNTFYGPQYLKWTFSTDYWGTRNYLNQVAAGSLKGAVYNETHWPPAGSDFASLYKQAVSAPDDATRKPIIHKMMEEEWASGGYIIPFFVNLVDAYSNKLTGFQPNRGTLNLDSYGHHWADVSFV